MAPGDFVILNWRALYGRRRACLRGRPSHLLQHHNARQKMTLTDGTELSPADPAASPAAAACWAEV